MGPSTQIPIRVVSPRCLSYPLRASILLLPSETTRIHPAFKFLDCQYNVWVRKIMCVMTNRSLDHKSFVVATFHEPTFKMRLLKLFSLLAAVNSPRFLRRPQHYVILSRRALAETRSVGQSCKNFSAFSSR